MKYFIFFAIFIASVWAANKTHAQNEIARCNIATIGRYVSSGNEIRWMPDNKTILRLGFSHGYTVERREIDAQEFSKVAVVSAKPEDYWNMLILNELNSETKTNLEIAADFLFARDQFSPGAINLEQGIEDLRERKAQEDMIYLIFVLTAIKDAKVAEALGLRFFDANIQPGKTYQYKITLNAQSPVYEVAPGSIIIQSKAESTSYINEVFVFPGDRQLTFAWVSKPELQGFFVERAAEGETTYKVLNTTPFYASSGGETEGDINATFIDDSLNNYQWYYYRFYGINAFGEKILFATARGMPRDLTPPANPIIRQPQHIKPKEVLVSWEQPGDTDDLRGYIVARSNTDTGNFRVLHSKILPPQSRNYTDTTFVMGGINYYIVYALDTAGNLSASFPSYVPLIDSIPPAKPKILSAIIDSSGIVTITIEQGKEPDLKGYRLYLSNDPEHEFSAIQEAFKEDREDPTPIKLIFYDTITLHSLTPKVYYRVKALDFNYNQSVFSDIIAVIRPDTIPPVSPVFSQVLVSERRIELYFIPSESMDVVQHILYRRTDPDSAWVKIQTFNTYQTLVIDTTVKTGVMYYYSMRAVDNSNLHSEFAHPVCGKPYDTGIRPPVQNITARLEKNEAVITWDYPLLKDKEVFFVIYKQNRAGQMLQYDRVQSMLYVDKNIEKDNYYAIKAMTTDGGQSVLSKPIYVKYE